MTGQKEFYDIFELIYPVGIIIELATNANPKDLFGVGEWEQIKDRFILAAGDSYIAGNIGGASTHVHSTGDHTLTVNEMPSHRHETNSVAWPSPSTDSSSYVALRSAHLSQQYDISGYVTMAGGSQPHNHGDTGSTSNMPPYYVAYLWRRVS